MIDEDNPMEMKRSDSESTKREDPDPSNGSLKLNPVDIRNGATIDFYLIGSDSPTVDQDRGAQSTAASLKPKKSVRWNKDLVMESPVTTRGYDHGFTNTYAEYSHAPSPRSPSFDFRGSMGSMKDVLGRWGKKVEEATRKAEDLAESTWQHLKTNQSLADAALGRIAHGTKVLAEGGYENIFRQTFETLPDEQLKYSYACYLSTSAGPIMGVLYVSTAKLAFSSDNPILHHPDDKTDCSYYKVVIPLHQLKAIKPSTNRTNSAEKYIEVVSMDGHEFWYMGFLNYCGAVQCLQEALQARHIESVYF